MTDGNGQTRRTVLGGIAAGAGLMSMVGETNAQAQGTSKTFVLVHGAWHGGWCWRRVSDRLEKKGHKVFTPTMTGLGERCHLIDPKVNLATHITDIVNVIKWEGLKDIVLVGHSYGGAIVWLDAFKPEDGQRSFDYASEFSRKALLASVEKGEPGRPGPKAEAFMVVNEKDRAWVDSKTTPQPNGVALQPIKLTGAREKVAKKTYIRAPKYPQPAFDKALAECKADKSWKTYETADAGHDVMVDAPGWLVDILLQVS